MNDDYIEPANIPDPDECDHKYSFALKHEECSDEDCLACQNGVDLTDFRYVLEYCPFCETYSVHEIIIDF